MSIVRVRPTWDVTRIEQARTLAQRSLCSRDQVGAIIVDARDKIIGEGYNGPPTGFKLQEKRCDNWCARAKGITPPNSTYDDCPSLHAEANALITSDRSLRMGGTIYVTSHVCMGCAKLIANSGLTRVYVGTRRQDQHREPDNSYAFLRKCGLVVEVHGPVMRSHDGS